MKKIALATAVALGVGAATANADEPYDIDWIGAYGIYYDIDEDKPEPIPYLDDGFGGGLEVGFRFDSHWAARIEAAYVDIGHDSSAVGKSQYGVFGGVDAMYFLDDDIAYVFAGAKVLDLDETYRMVNAGVGKHWTLTEKLKVITEVAGLYDFGQEHRDVSVKLGLAYTFGDSSAPDMASSKPAMAAADSDNDGVIDSADRCPGTPAGTKVDNNGCAMPVAAAAPAEKDSDKDGVFDSADQCPNTPMGDVVDEDGCTRFGEKVLTQTVRVLFGNDSDVVQNVNDPEIIEFANFLKRYGKVDAVIEGHASAQGNADYNMQLSQRRAAAFMQVLIDTYGISASRLQAIGYGETRLLDTSNTAEAHRINRRIAVTVSETVKVKLQK